MATKQILQLKDTSNVASLNLIRSNASLEYQNRIPKATQANIQTTIRSIMNYTPTKNEFVASLVNVIGSVVARDITWNNPLAVFKQGLMEFGDTIEEIQVGLLEAHTYQSDRDGLERAIFSQELPDIQTNFHKVNRMEYYKVSINDTLLRRAFQTSDGVSKLAAQLMGAPTTSDQVDEFKLTCSLFKEYEAMGGFYKVNVPDVKDLDSSAPEARQALRKLRTHADLMKFPNTAYNAAGMPTFTNPEDLVIFCTPEFKAAMDVEALAGAFNLQHMEATGRFIVLPEVEFGIEGCQAIMTTKDFFIIADVALENRQMPNPVGLYENHFLHHHEIISFSRFVPAIMFTTGPGDEVVRELSPVTGVSAITVTDQEGATVTNGNVVRGALYSLDAEAITDGNNDGVRYSLAGATSPSTYVTQYGVLHVGGQEGSDTLVVTATSTYLDPENLMRDGATSTRTLTVTGPAEYWANGENGPAVEGITVKGVPVPGFSPSVFTYNGVAVEGGTATWNQVKVTGPDAGDVKVTTSNAGATIKVSSHGSEGDPVYTINLVATA